MWCGGEVCQVAVLCHTRPCSSHPTPDVSRTLLESVAVSQLLLVLILKVQPTHALSPYLVILQLPSDWLFISNAASCHIKVCTSVGSLQY